MTAKATNAPPTPDPVDGESELKRYSPEEVAQKKLLPFSARMLREKAYRREIYHHNDGGRISFTADDIRKNSELGAVKPLSETKPARKKRSAA